MKVLRKLLWLWPTQQVSWFNEYKEEVVNRYKKINEMQNAIKNAGLNEDQGKNLHSLLQGYYKEWLMNTNAIKPITDLIKLIDQE